MPSQDSEVLRAVVERRQGQACLFREKTLIFPCRIDSAISDSWGVRVALVQTPASGFLYPKSPRLNISCAWGWGSIGDREWSGAQGAAWVLYFDETLLRSIKPFASSIAHLKPMERFEQLQDHIHEWQIHANS